MPTKASELSEQHIVEVMQTRLNHYVSEVHTLQSSVTSAPGVDAQAIDAQALQYHFLVSKIEGITEVARDLLSPEMYERLSVVM